MKRFLFLAVALCLFGGTAAVAQEHWTEGPVWNITFYRTTPGHFDDYIKYLRSHYIVTTAESKKQGLILDSKIYVKQPRDANDWDIAIATLFPSYGKALDFNSADDEKSKAIQAQHWKTADRSKQQEMSAPRLGWRTFVGSDIVREVNLKPLP
ncbi:MAG: hypothetical protein WAU32_12895 [Thermoanaerobaculia bacterium]